MSALAMDAPDVEAAVMTRLRQTVPGLVSVEDALALARLVDERQVPARTPAAFVVWEGDRATPPAVGSGPHLQAVTETIAVVVVHRHRGDAGGTAAKVALRPLRDGVLGALSGWGAAGFTPLAYERGRLDAIGTGGAAAFTLTFSTTWTLRT